MSLKYAAARVSPSHYVLERRGDMRCDVHAWLSGPLYEATDEALAADGIDLLQHGGGEAVDLLLHQAVDRLGVGGPAQRFEIAAHAVVFAVDGVAEAGQLSPDLRDDRGIELAHGDDSPLKSRGFDGAARGPDRAEKIGGAAGIPQVGLRWDRDAGIPQVSPSATNPKYTRQGFKTTFRVVADDTQLGGTLGK